MEKYHPQKIVTRVVANQYICKMPIDSDKDPIISRCKCQMEVNQRSRGPQLQGLLFSKEDIFRVTMEYSLSNSWMQQSVTPFRLDDSESKIDQCQIIPP